MQLTLSEQENFDSIFSEPTIDNIQSLNGNTFPKFVAYLFQKDGLYESVVSDGPYDESIDIELYIIENGLRQLAGVVQCKANHISKLPVDRPNVVIFDTLSNILSVSRRYYFSTTGFTVPAKTWARNHKVILYGPDAIRNFILDIRRRTVHTPLDLQPIAVPVIGFVNNKGGVGKTTLVLNIAATLASEGFSVLVIDADPQCNSTRILIGDKGIDQLQLMPSLTLEGVIGERHPISPLIRTTTNFEGVYLLPCHENMRKYIEKMNHDSERILGHALAQLSLVNPPIDVILIDTQPDLTRLTRSAIIASSHLVIPVEIDELSRQGIRSLLSFVDEAEQLHEKQVRILGAIASNVEQRANITSSMQSGIASVALTHSRIKKQGLSPDQFWIGQTRHLVDFPGATSNYKSVIGYKPRSDATKEIKVLTERIKTLVKLIKQPANS